MRTLSAKKLQERRIVHLAKTAPYCGIPEGLEPLWLFFARPLARFLRQLRCSAQSRALARSFASRLVSSKSHPTGGKKRQHSRSVKTYPRRNGIQGSHFAPKSSATSIRLTPENRPKLQVPRGSAPWRGLGQSPKRTLRTPGAEPQKNFAYTGGKAPKALCDHQENLHHST